MSALRKKRPRNNRELAYGMWSGEIIACCPRCKALQVVSINEDKLIPTRKFNQKGTGIYHDCGSGQPCHLYHGW